MTTATDEVMPTLRDIEQGLRARLAEIEQARTTEREQRERARRKIEQVAQDAASNNSIGEEADDLLEELGLHGRPISVVVTVDVEYRQVVETGQMRYVRLNSDGTQPWTAYHDTREALLFTTSRCGVAVQVPRRPEDRDGCACSVPITDDLIAAAHGRMPSNVERVDVTVIECGMRAYPFTRSATDPCGCLTLRRAREVEIEQAVDSPTVQQCEHQHRHTSPHRHVFYPNGDVTYTVQQDYHPDDATVAQGWYGTGEQVGQPVPGTPQPVVEDPNDHTVQVCTLGHPERVHWHFTDHDAPHRVAYDEVGNDPYGWDRVPGVFGPTAGELLQSCTQSGHPLQGPHLHFLHTDNGRLTYTRTLDYVSHDPTVERQPGLFTRDEHHWNTVHVDTSIVSDDDDEEDDE